jgi:phosphoglycolate phosphatase
LDGTLVDSGAGILDSLEKAISLCVPELVMSARLAVIGPPIAAIIESIMPAVSAQLKKEVENTYRDIYDSTGWSKAALYDGVKDFFQHADNSGIQCMIATNKPSLPTRKILEALELAPYLNACVCPDSSDPRFCSKTEMVACMLGSRNIATDSAIFVGDSFDDYEAACNNRLKFVAVGYGYGNVHLRQDVARVASIFRFSDLTSIVDGAGNL